MSRVEHVSSKHADCLCGRGQVTKSVSTTDYAFGSADISYSLDCDACSREWRLEDGALVLCASEGECDALREELGGVSAQVRRLVPRIVDAHFELVSHPTRKAEWSEMSRLGLGGGTYRNYAAERRMGRTPGQVANPWGKDAKVGLAEIAEARDRAEVLRLYATREDLKTRLAAAAERVVIRKAPPGTGRD